MCMYVCMYVSMLVGILCVYTCGHAFMCACMYVYMYACMCAYMHVCMKFSSWVLSGLGENCSSRDSGGGIVRGQLYRGEMSVPIFHIHGCPRASLIPSRSSSPCSLSSFSSS